MTLLRFVFAFCDLHRCALVHLEFKIFQKECRTTGIKRFKDFARHRQQTNQQGTNKPNEKKCVELSFGANLT